MLAHLWHAGIDENSIGTATTGSSEAIHLGGLAMKRIWVEKRLAAGKDASKPNIIMGANAQVALEKFARYFDVEARIVPVSEESRYCLDVKKIPDFIDENTIGIFVILGSTYTGHYESVQEVSNYLDQYEKETGHYVPIHVDGASGAMVAPFAHRDLVWDFKIPRVVSINTSGHKFGLSPVGVGWVVWRDAQYLPKYLIFELGYLGGSEATYTLNFSRPGAPILAQYFNFIHFGREGYKQIQDNDLINARILSEALEETGYFECVSDIHRRRGKLGKQKHPEDAKIISSDAKDYNEGLPVVAFKLSESYTKKHPHVQQGAISTLLRVKGWILPNYTLPPNEQKTEILRAVIRQSFTGSMCERLLFDIVEAAELLAAQKDQTFIAALSNPSNKGSVLRRLSAVRLSSSKEEYHEKYKNHGVFKGIC